jgi:hypothetical protein
MDDVDRLQNLFLKCYCSRQPKEWIKVKMEVASPSVPLKDAACFALKKSSSILL